VTGPAVEQTVGIRTPHFWEMYVMVVLVSGGGLMATAQLGPI